MSAGCLVLMLILCLAQILNAQSPCLLNPCRNGNCLPTGQSSSSFQCQCFTGFTGQLCDMKIPLIHPCTINPCFNGGSCSTNDGKTFVCRCPPNYTGIRCEKLNNALASDVCRTSNPCLNGATCVNVPFTNANPAFACICQAAFTGQTCNIQLNQQQLVNRCLQNPCSNGGTCVQSLQSSTGYVCNCPSTHFGSNCQFVNDRFIQDFSNQQQQQDACRVLNPCLNGATCVNVPYANASPKYACICQTTYTGQNCQTRLPTNTLNDPTNRPACNQPYCQNGGTCYLNRTLANIEYPVCICRRGYVGLQCEADVCKLNIVSGPCQASLQRYAYNFIQKQCVPFLYGGCQANLNNFETQDECQRVCNGR